MSFLEKGAKGAEGKGEFLGFKFRVCVKSFKIKILEIPR